MGSCNFSFLKNTRVEIISKLNEKSRMITLNTQPHTEGFWVLTLGHTRNLHSKTSDPPDKMVYFMSRGAAEDLWLHQTWTASWPPSWILLRITNRVRASTDSKNRWVEKQILELTGV